MHLRAESNRLDLFRKQVCDQYTTEAKPKEGACWNTHFDGVDLNHVAGTTPRLTIA